jgi:ribonuclease D
VSHRVVVDQHDFDEVVAALRREPRYALDTEFHRERTYFPKLALVQLAWPGDLVLVDPLQVDVAALRPLFTSDVLAVLHAAQQDLDVLQHAVGAVPSRLYDTQLAAGFLGYSTPSLVSLLQSELHVSTPKGDRLTDWLRRPLTESQREYAAADVAHLLALHDRIEAALVARGRASWAADACEELRTRPVSGAQPDDAWRRLKDARTLRPRARAVAQAVAAWRERRAMDQDVPVRQVLPDLAILGISQRQPRTAAELSQSRGVDERHSRGAIAAEILAAVEAGAATTPPEMAPSGEELDRGLRPAVTLVSAWVSQVARDEDVDTALLATRSDLTAFLRGDADARLLHGWRSAIVGDSLRRLVSGEAGLTFDGNGNLRLIEGSSVR